MNLVIQRPANDNRPGLAAEFVKLLEVFLQVYQADLLEWAANLQDRGPFLDVTLWNAPGATILSPGYQGKVRLRCDAMVNPATKAVRLVIQPADEEDEASVRRHCEVLPAILHAQRAAADANRGKARGAVKAVFDLPEYFVQRYWLELRAWGQNLKTIGLVKTIVLREGNLSELSPDPEIGAVLLGVKLQAKIERIANDEIQLLISPASERDRRVIANHVQKLTSVGVPARAALVEPPRPGIPTVPNIIGASPPPSDGGI